MSNDYDERDDEVYCTNITCSWQGRREELVSLTDDDDDNDFSYCPRCDGEVDDL